MSQLGQSRRFEHAETLSDQPRGADLSDANQLFGNVPQADKKRAPGQVRHREAAGEVSGHATFTLGPYERRHTLAGARRGAGADEVIE